MNVLQSGTSLLSVAGVAEKNIVFNVEDRILVKYYFYKFKGNGAKNREFLDKD